jgi:hypothetical protein
MIAQYEDGTHGRVDILIENSLIILQTSFNLKLSHFFQSLDFPLTVLTW